MQPDFFSIWIVRFIHKFQKSEFWELKLKSDFFLIHIFYSMVETVFYMTKFVYI